jgi:tetratricopeptide (TPR) repeat protein
MFRISYCLRILLLFALTGALHAEPTPAAPTAAGDAFGSAVAAYNAGKMDDARRDFLAIVEKGQISAAVAHNLGNLEFRRGEPGQAVLWYKRALALQPASPETLQNLRTIRQQTGFLTFDPYGISRSHVKAVWFKNLTILCAWGTVLLIVWLAWWTPRAGRRWPLITLLVLTAPCLIFSARMAWWLKTDPAPLANRQIIAGKETEAYSAPAEASPSVIRLPSGSEAVPLETRGNWVYCLLPGGEEGQPLRGWIRSAKLEPLWPWQREI